MADSGLFTGGVLRKLTPQDKQLITELFTDVFTGEPWHDDWSDREQLDAYIDDLTGQRYSLTLGFFADHRLAGLSMGYIKHWCTGTEYIINEFCVDRQLQGRGIGTAFLQAIEQYLSENGIRQIFLLTDRNVPAYAFYLRNGFIEQESSVSFVLRID